MIAIDPADDDEHDKRLHNIARALGADDETDNVVGED